MLSPDLKRTSNTAKHPSHCRSAPVLRFLKPSKSDKPESIPQTILTMFTTTIRRSLRTPLRSALPTTTRPYHASTTRLQKDKKSNLLDKDSINTDATEYSKSAGDGTSAATEDAAFSTDKTRPEEQHDAASREADQQGVSGVYDVVFLQILPA